MAIELDHFILGVSDREKSLAFYTGIVGFAREPDDGSFSTLRVAPGFMILLAPWAPKGGEHFAFSMSKREFDDMFGRIKAAGIPFGDRYDGVGNMQGPRDEIGSRGPGKAVYFYDPDQNLLEIRHYESD